MASRSFLAKYSGNIAGFFWNSGTALQFAFGLIVLSPREIVSSAFNVASPCCYMFCGHKNWGVVVGSLFGTAGTFLAVYPAIMDGEIGSIFGFVSFCIFVSFSIFSAPLTRRFHAVPNAIWRETLGHPRRLDGLGLFFFARVPIIGESLTHGRFHLAAVFAVWAVGDLVFCFSKAEI